MKSRFARRMVRGIAGYIVAVAALGAVVAAARVFPHTPRPIAAYAGLLVLLGSAWWGGYGPGIAVTLTAAFGIPYFVTHTFSWAKVNYTQLGLLLLVSVLVSLVAAGRRKVEGALRRANETLDERVRQRTAELERANLILQEREAQLLRQAEELSLSNAHLEQFAYVASHDLQEPLRMIAIYTELIERRSGGFDSESQRYMATVVEGVRRMETLIRDLLSYSRAIHATSEPEPMDSGDALRAALTNLETAIVETGAVIGSRGLPVIDVDRMLLTQIFQNLLSNALKYRSAIRPEIEISARLQDGQWIFAVADNGIGINSTYHETIFSPFKRLHSSRYPGTGVGLAICRQVLDRLGGKIWVESEPGAGATFYFSIPVAEQGAERTSTTVAL